jgi:antitoxin (DNA-binding transcriptional repressor) of toxin-antitoxin stability system
MIKVMDKVKTTGQSVVTNHGELSTNVVPAANSKANEIFGFFSDKGRVIGNIVSPALSSTEWGNLS